MRTQSPDTSPDVERRLIEMTRRLPIERRIQLAARFSTSLRQMAWNGLRQRHPEATACELRRRFAELHLGPAIAQTLFGNASMAEHS